MWFLVVWKFLSKLYFYVWSLGLQLLNIRFAILGLQCLSFSRHNDAESLWNYAKTMILDLKCAKFAKFVQFGPLQTSPSRQVLHHQIMSIKTWSYFFFLQKLILSLPNHVFVFERFHKVGSHKGILGFLSGFFWNFVPPQVGLYANIMICDVWMLFLRFSRQSHAEALRELLPQYVLDPTHTQIWETTAHMRRFIFPFNSVFFIRYCGFQIH